MKYLVSHGGGSEDSYGAQRHGTSPWLPGIGKVGGRRHVSEWSEAEKFEAVKMRVSMPGST